MKQFNIELVRRDKVKVELDKHHYELGQSISHDAGSWKTLKYGRPITMED